MLLLTKIQKDFIIETFFQPNSYLGRLSAILLLDFGDCVVAGSDCIWVGGIGDYIKISPVKKDYSLYEFSFEDFMKSELYKQGYLDYREGLLDLDVDIELIMPLDMRRDLLIDNIIN